MTEFVPAYAPSYGTPISVEYRTLENEFGDGYEQIVQDGLNNIKETWEVVWNNISDTNAQAIRTQLDAFAGTAFEWETPEGVTKQFTCKKMTRTFTGYLTCNLTATFREFTNANG